MTELSVFIVLVLVALLVGAIVAIVILGYFYVSLRSQISQRIEKGFTAWREKELDAVRKEQTELAQAQATVSLAVCRRGIAEWVLPDPI
jgi:H+/gluconate symporter-like permease